MQAYAKSNGVTIMTKDETSQQALVRELGHAELVVSEKLHAYADGIKETHSGRLAIRAHAEAARMRAGVYISWGKDK